jgi:cell division protein FtsN
VIVVPRSSRRYNQNPNCPPGWLWLLAGLLIGMFLSFLIYLRGIDTHAPPDIHAENMPSAEKPVEAKVKTPSLSPRFEFYEILPQSGVNSPVMAVSEVEEAIEIVDSPPAPTVMNAMSAPVPETPSAQILQVGAFRNAQEAEGLKAHLAMLGIRSQVRAAADNSGVWHRVEVGPVKSFGQLERLQAQLRTHNIAFIAQPAN